MTPDDRQVYAGLLHLKEMEMVLTDLTTYVNKQITLEAIHVAPGTAPPPELNGKIVMCRINMTGEIEGELLFGSTLALIQAFSVEMLGLPKVTLEKYIAEEIYDSDVADAAKEVLNLATGSLEKSLRKDLEAHVGLKMNMEIIDVTLGTDGLPDLANQLGDWVFQEASLEELGVSGNFFQFVPDAMSMKLADFWAQNLEIGAARQMLGAAANMKIGEESAAKVVKGKTRILIVEDTHMIRRLMSQHLKKAGYEVLEKDEGTGAVRRASLMGSQLDLIILDLKIPGIPGLEVVQALRSNERTKEIPIMISSSNLNKQSLQELLKWGIRDFLVKPFTRETLISKTVKLAGRP